MVLWEGLVGWIYVSNGTLDWSMDGWIAAFCDVDVALFIRIRKTGRLITYKSLDLESWPPSREQIVSLQASPKTIR